MALQVTKLGELFIACIELAGKWFCRSVDYFMCPYVATLCKCLSADVAAVWSLSSVTSFVSLEVSQLRKPLTTACFFADLYVVSDSYGNGH